MKRRSWCNIYLLRKKMKMNTRVQILDKTACISRSAHTLGKSKNPIILPHGMGK